MTKHTTNAIILLLLAGGCNDPAAEKPAATVGEVEPSAPPVVDKAADGVGDAPAARALPFSAENSSIQLVGSKVTGSHDIKINDFTGSVTLPSGAALESGSVEVTMKMASIEADHPKLTGHLKTGDFFLVEEHPESSFKSTAIKAGGADGATHTVTGNLTLRGVTKALTFPATIKQQGEAVTVKAEFSINRKDFGVVYAGMPDDLIRDDVVIKLDIKAG